MVLVVFVIEQWRNSVSFAQATPFSPRRELQEFIQGLGSSNSLKRPRLGLSETQSRSGESGSPKRGREEVLEC